MKCAYEAANAVEAHMIANLLAQHSIVARIDGEFLAGGVGELPAAGLVRVMVDEENYSRAREVIREWEASSPPPTPRRDYAMKAPARFAWFMLGAIVTIATMSLLSRSQRSDTGVDFNGDGKLDEKYTFQDGRISKVEGDANLDGRVDYIVSYDEKSLPLALQSDLNFDGRFEMKQSFERSNARRIDIDWDQDGRVDRREDYTNGVLTSVTLYAPDGYSIVKRERFTNGLLVEAQLDADADGVMETTYRYDRYGEIVEAVRR